MLDRINALKDKSELPALIGQMHSAGVNVLFAFGSEPDAKDSKMEIAGTDQGGLGLPDRDYYLKDDAKSAEIRKQYEQHVANMFKLAGDSPDKAAAEAKTVMQVETALAKASLDRTERRDPSKVYHKMTKQQLQELSPAFNWNEYLVAVKSPEFTSLDVSVPDFVKGMNQVIATSDLNTIKTYLRWQTLHAAAPLLPNAFVEENFNFYDKTLRGAKELRPRWKRCVTFTDNDLGEALGQAYVAEAFPPESKAAMLKMVHELEAALKQDITELSWMSPETKKQALDKLAHIDNKIGYPEQVARLQLAGYRARRRTGQFDARQPVRVQAPAQQNQQAGRSPGMGHDSADGQRLLQSAGKQHQLSRPGSFSLRSTTRTPMIRQTSALSDR